MPKKSFIDEIKVKDPCAQDWETMRGNETVRFCDHCSKNVTDISTLTRKAAVKLVRGSNGNLCVRYLEDTKTRTPLFAGQLVRLTRRAPSLASGVVGASLALSNAAYTQGSVASRASQEQISKKETSMESKKAKRNDPMSEISGTVTDTNGAVVAGARVNITNTSTRVERSTVTNEEGKYSIRDLAPGEYEGSISSQGFMLHKVEKLNLGNDPTAADAILQVAGAVVGELVITEPEYESPLSKAIEDDDIEAFREAIAAGANVNSKEKENGKITPLFVAVENGNVELARMLLDLGAKVNARDSLRQTPLMRLDDDSDAEMVELLLQHGAKIDLEDKSGNTALILAAEHATAEVLEALLNRGPDVNAANNVGQTALMNAAYDDDLEKVRLLLNAGADVDAKNDEGETAWDQTGDKEIEDLLVSYGAITKDKDQDDSEDDEEPYIDDEPSN